MFYFNLNFFTIIIIVLLLAVLSFLTNRIMVRNYRRITFDPLPPPPSAYEVNGRSLKYSIFDFIHYHPLAKRFIRHQSCYCVFTIVPKTICP